MEQSEVMDYYTPVSALEDMEAEMELSESYTSMEDFEKISVIPSPRNMPE